MIFLAAQFITSSPVLPHQKWMQLIACLLLCLIHCSWSDNQADVEDLHRIRRTIENVTSSFCYGGHSGCKQSFLSKRWKDATKDRLTWVYPFCLTTNELGNRLGNYFTEVGCAHVAGVDFVTVHSQWDIVGSSFTGKSQNLTQVEKLHFLKALPEVIVHPNKVDEATAIQRVQEHCKCTRYCWQDPNAAWLKSLPLIQKIMRDAITAYFLNIKSTNTTINQDTDITNAKPGEYLPLVPDVAIQYRCGDNIGFSYMYGILPFTAFPSRIPENAKYIYVLSDHPSRAPHSPYTSKCEMILQHLLTYILQHRPNATVVIKRGGDMFLDYARLSFANVTICSASSYCFWAAISNTKGTVHFPCSVLIAGADNIGLAPNMTALGLNNFHWIGEPAYISNFRNYKPWTLILDVLKGITP